MLILFPPCQFEDFQGDKAGLDILERFCPSTEAAIAEIDDALSLMDGEEKDAIGPRLQFRKVSLLAALMRT